MAAITNVKKKRRKVEEKKRFFRKDGHWITFLLKIQTEGPCVLFATKSSVITKNTM